VKQCGDDKANHYWKIDAMKKKATIKQVSEAIDIYGGNIAAIADHLGVTRQTIYNRINKHPQLEEKIEDARETTKDRVRQTIENLALEGNVPLLIFYAKTQMGWKETQVTEQKGELSYIVNWGDNDD